MGVDDVGELNLLHITVKKFSPRVRGPTNTDANLRLGQEGCDLFQNIEITLGRTVEPRGAEMRVTSLP